MGQARTATAGSGLPNRCRQAEASADIGFHSAIGCSQPGMPALTAAPALTPVLLIAMTLSLSRIAVTTQVLHRLAAR